MFYTCTCMYFSVFIKHVWCRRALPQWQDRWQATWEWVKEINESKAVWCGIDDSCRWKQCFTLDFKDRALSETTKLLRQDKSWQQTGLILIEMFNIPLIASQAKYIIIYLLDLSILLFNINEKETTKRYCCLFHNQACLIKGGNEILLSSRTVGSGAI